MAKRKQRVFKSELVDGLTKQNIKAALDQADIWDSSKKLYTEVGMKKPSWSYFVRTSNSVHSLKAIVTLACQRIDESFVSTNFNARKGADRLEAFNFDVIHLESKPQAVEFERLQRQRVEAQRLARPDQVKFRMGLINIYRGQCAISGCNVLEAIDAAHIQGVGDAGSDNLDNGILLRSDLHRLFDNGLIAINPANGAVHFSKCCRTSYKELEDTIIKLPKNGPSLKAFTDRWIQFCANSTPP